MITAQVVRWRTAKNRISQAIYRQPRLFIMDEVTSATDSHTTQLITESIRELREQSQRDLNYPQHAPSANI